jgi:hypothetical protein
MGKYINKINEIPLGTSFKEKCTVLETMGAIKVTDKEFLPDMVCVVDNGFFAAAGYAYDRGEWQEFRHPCGRPKQWYTLPNASKHID